MLNNIEDLYPDIVCPISKQIMKNPVITNNGITYEKIDILKWLEKKKICPITGEYLDNSMLISNIQLKNTIVILEEKLLSKERTNNLDERYKCCIIL